MNCARHAEQSIGLADQCFANVFAQSIAVECTDCRHCRDQWGILTCTRRSVSEQHGNGRNVMQRKWFLILCTGKAHNLQGGEHVRLTQGSVRQNGAHVCGVMHHTSHTRAQQCELLRLQAETAMTQSYVDRQHTLLVSGHIHTESSHIVEYAVQKRLRIRENRSGGCSATGGEFACTSLAEAGRSTETHHRESGRRVEQATQQERTQEAGGTAEQQSTAAGQGTHLGGREAVDHLRKRCRLCCSFCFSFCSVVQALAELHVSLGICRLGVCGWTGAARAGATR
mmetsp:Transcript_30974/g.77771  ORF Transcript_30974/g.77771 Transcript_30974/m.77771 type:complete len:283 (+) Transcript_30974:622-1470(+)